MDSKISVTLIKSKGIDGESNVNKMAVHIENLLTEKAGVEFKTRNSLTDSVIKSSKFVIFCGFDSQLISEIFKTLAFIESNPQESQPMICLYDEPGNSIYEHIDRILMRGIDLNRTYSKIHDRIMDCWSYRDIIGLIDIEIRRLESSRNVTDNPAVV